ncbi:MAG: glycosyl transferase family 2 [Blastocatellia bacterium AA13]|nr:MAG: glycosyl transferase family 2 [Blastocatellia bacterium AA13]
MKIPSKLGFTLLTFLLLTATALAADKGAIAGNIVDKREYVMGGLNVIAIGRDIDARYETTAGPTGAFAFDEVEPGSYTLITECEGIEKIVKLIEAQAGRVTQVELSAVAIQPTGNAAIDKYVASQWSQGGRYPAGNISYLNLNDEQDLYFMLVYFGILGLLSVYGVYRYRLVYLFLRYKTFAPRPQSKFPEDKLPRVTVQLPLFNEMYVAERLIESVVKLDYPRELLEIQVLDDSTDDTVGIASAVVKKYFDQGYDITYHHREDRYGFKAGALEAGLKKSSGEFILIFDADFVPRPDCIRRAIHYFTDDRIGMVQMRWSHINTDYSLLTKVQAIMLNAHFVIEQTARSRCGGFFNFNGTAGIWRREAIEWSGGWQHDTLAEDTDLSYRAQLMGWRFVYLLDEDVPSELPIEMNAFKSQQKRWAKGVVQVGLKMLPRIRRDPRLPLRVKLEQFFRLTGNLAAPLVIVLALINLPILIVRYNQGFFHLFVLDVPVLTFSTVSVIVYYIVSERHLHPKGFWKSLKYLPFVMSMGIALTFSNARAVLEAICGVKTPFVRTPKYGIENQTDSSWLRKRYVPRRLALPMIELLFTAYFIFTVWYAVHSQIFATLPFLLIYLLGYAYAAVMSIVQGRISLRRTNGNRK